MHKTTSFVEFGNSAHSIIKTPFRNVSLWKLAFRNGALIIERAEFQIFAWLIQIQQTLWFYAHKELILSQYLIINNSRRIMREQKHR